MVSLATQEYKINQYLTLKLENDKVNIYVNDKLVNMCKHLILDVPLQDVDQFNEFNSIDEIADRIDKTIKGKKSLIPLELEFWGHCSNIQAWVENDYDTRILHSKLAFPLLKTLASVGDPKAKKNFKDEIFKRLISGYKPVIQTIFNGDYLDYFSIEELNSLASAFLDDMYKIIDTVDPEIKEILEQMLLYIDNIEVFKNFILLIHYYKYYDFHSASKFFKDFLNNSGNNSRIKKDFYSFLNTLNVEYVVYHEEIFPILSNYSLHISRNIRHIKEIQGLNSLQDLNALDLRNNQISEINELENLVNLEELDLANNKISHTIGLGKLVNLKKLNLNENNLSEIGKLSKLVKLERLLLYHNQIVDASPLSSLQNLNKITLGCNKITNIERVHFSDKIESLNLDENQIINVHSLGKLTNLKRLSIRHNNVDTISTFGNLKNLTYLNLTGNKTISEVDMLKNCKNLNYLILGENNITQVDGLSSLDQLIFLDISYTKVTEIPDSFKDMKSLKGVRVVGCDISYFPIELNDRIIYYQDEDIVQFEKETSKNAVIMGRESKKFLMYLKKKR